MWQERASWRFVELFTLDIRNPAALAEIQPIHVAAYVVARQKECAAPTVKQHLACLRMLFDWLVTAQVVAR